MAESLKDKSLTAILWVVIDKLGSSSVNFIVTIILARLLLPEDFGLVAMVMIFFEISTVFIQSGFAYALIREKSISEIDKSTTFVFNLVMAVVVYIILFFGAPAIGAFFKQPGLAAIVRVMGINLIISAFGIIHYAILTQKIDFKTQTKVRFFAVIISGVVAVTMALTDYGVWSLVAKMGVMELMAVLFVWKMSPWKISVRFSFASFKKLFGFGSKLLMEALIDKFFRHIVQLLIGRYFTAAMLGFYTQANNFCNMAANNFNQAIQKVTYPVLAKLQDDKKRLKDGYRQIIIMSSFTIIPIMVLMGVLAEPLINVLIGKNWLDSVPFLQLLCLAGVTYHFNSINLDLLFVIGRVDLSLRLEVIKKIITGVAIVIGIQFGIYGLVLSQVVSNYIALFINTYYSDKFLNYPLREQMKDTLPSVLFSCLMGGIVWLIKYYVETHGIIFLIFGALFGGACYLTFHYLAKTREMDLLRWFIIPKAIKFISNKS